MPYTYTHIVVDIHDQIGVIKVCPTLSQRISACLPQQLNRPNVLNAWNETMLADMVTAFRELDENPRTIFTVLTGEGRFFSAGADIRRMFLLYSSTAFTVIEKIFIYLTVIQKDWPHHPQTQPRHRRNSSTCVNSPSVRIPIPHTTKHHHLVTTKH